MFKIVQPVAWDPVKLHDIWNLWVLGLLNALNLHYLATGAGFAPFWTAAQLYFLFDTVFVGACVRARAGVAKWALLLC
jgi:hypothetical protein